MNFAQFAQLFALLDKVSGVAADAVTAAASSDHTHPSLGVAASVLNVLHNVLEDAPAVAQALAPVAKPGTILSQLGTAPLPPQV